jgi:hypothetical protein
MKAFLRFVLTVSVAGNIVVSCTTVRVNYDYDKSTDFSNYSTYNYYPELNTGLSDLDSRRLMDALDSVMQTRGFLLSEEPDFLINIQSNAYRTPRGSAVGVGVGGTGGNVGGGVSIGLPLNRNNLEREIIFDLIDSQKDVLFWQAVSNSVYSENATPLNREKVLQQVVQKVFSKYPPSK